MYAVKTAPANAATEITPPIQWPLLVSFTVALRTVFSCSMRCACSRSTIAIMRLAPSGMIWLKCSRAAGGGSGPDQCCAATVLSCGKGSGRFSTLRGGLLLIDNFVEVSAYP